MMKKTISILMLAASISFVTSANASRFNYDYGDVSYGVAGGDADINGNGNIEIAASHEIKPNMNLIGSYATDRTLNVFHAGVGMHKSIKHGTDALASIKYVNNNINGSGYGVSAGLRHDFSNDFEGEVSIDFVDVEVSTTRIKAGSRYHFSREMSAGLGVDDSGSLTFNLRMSY